MLDVRIYDENGNRKYFPNDKITSVSWELLERGYYGSFSIELSESFGGDLAFTGADRVDIYLDDELRYRGYVGTPEQSFDLSEKVTVTGYGLAARLESILVDKWYVHPGGVDVSQVVAAMLADYISPRISGLALDIQTVGYTTEELQTDNQKAREVIDSLADLCAKEAVWGFDVDGDGNNRFFFRPKGSAVNYKFSPGKYVKTYSYPPDYSQIVNTVHLVGAEAKFPNLVENSSFERPKQTDTSDGNALLDSGFEADPSSWTFAGGASRLERSARTGTAGANLDHDTEYVEQTVDVTGGATYTLQAWAKCPDNSGSGIYFTVTPDVGSVITYPATDWAAAGVNWGQISTSLTFDALATSAAVRISYGGSESGHDVFVDDAALFETAGIVQEKWQFDDGDTDGIIDWVHEDDKQHGSYGVKVSATSGTACYLKQSESAAFSVEPYKKYVLSADIGLTDLVHSSMRIRFFLVKTNKSGTESTEYLGGGAYQSFIDASWARLHDEWSAGADDAKARVGIEISTASTWYNDTLVDAVMLAEYNPADPSGDYFIEGNRMEWDLSTDDQFVPALPAVVKGSRSAYGIRQSLESVDAVSTRAQAENWALGYFGVKAQPVVSHRVEVVGWEGEIAPDGLVQLLGTDIPPAFPVRVGYTYGDAVKVSLDLNTERPTFARLMQKTLEAARAEARKQAR
ncbi:MAG: hypothetical protein ACYC2Y_11205 [Armatimonadota bacterium]